MKILKFFRQNLVKFAVCISFSASLVLSPLSFAFAAPAVVPVASEAVYALLVALGLMAGDSVNGYTWIGNGNAYTDDIFNTASPGFTSGVKKANENLAEAQAVLDKVLAENTYTTDGSNFYVGEKRVTASDLFLTAKSLIGVSYTMPTNINGLLAPVGTYIHPSYGWQLGYCHTSSADIGKDIWYFPYIQTRDNKAYIFSNAFTMVDDGQGVARSFNFSSNTSTDRTFNSSFYLSSYYYFPIGNSWGHGFYMGDAEPSKQLTTYLAPVQFIPVNNSVDFSYNAENSFGLLTTHGKPVREITADSEKLGNSIVQVKPSEDDDNNGNTPPVPQSPDNWQIWKSFEDLITFVDTGDSTNGGTTLGDFVNNNYNYVDVDINVPDKIDNNVNLSGGLDISGQGDINVTVHEDVSLPSAGDGTGFYNPNAADVVGALGKDNPVTSVLSGLFSALDPSLVGVFSISVSLLFALGLWKLIRG